jgi:hypothetical protein
MTAMPSDAKQMTFGRLLRKARSALRHALMIDGLD